LPTDRRDRARSRFCAAFRRHIGAWPARTAHSGAAHAHWSPPHRRNRTRIGPHVKLRR
jgi:hypothetical protein